MAWLLAELAAGRLRPVVDRSYPLDGVPEAMARLAAGAARGKLVIEV
jgi:NADPH:quinone reductase-like Zn-dependent oxidoreductase